MKIPFVDLKKQYQNHKSEIDIAIQNVIDQTSFIGGFIVKKFENEFAAAYGVKYCIGVGNGTDAIYITLKMLGIGVGDEVITTACSWVSTSETISQTGAQPIFVDIKEDYLIDADQIEAKITPRTKAITSVHLYGQMADMSNLKELCKKHELLLIEDCAQAHFSERDGLRAGLSGNAATFSFYPGKNLGAYGDAGAIITNDDQLAEKCRMFANHGQLTKHDHKIEGINSRLDAIQAAVLTVKLKYISEWTENRKGVAQQYFDELRDIPELRLPVVNANSEHAYHLFVVAVKKRKKLIEHLMKNGVETSIHYPSPLPFLECYRYLNHNKEDFPMADKLSAETLSLPMFPELTAEEVSYVCSAIKSFYS